MHFRGKYWFLSNMSDSPIRLTSRGQTYQFSCVESAFQACKCMERMGEFQNLTGQEAKRLGQTVQLRPDWEEKKVDIMRQLVGMKFRQNPELKQALLATGDEYIQEDNTWNDTFWGCVNGQGRNELGKILMTARQQFQQQLQTQTQVPAQAPAAKPAADKKNPQVLMDGSDIYDLPQGPGEILCITTNGCIKKNGDAVMGAGIALTANQRFNLAPDLGKLLAQYKNHVFDMGMRTDSQTGRQVHIVTLPTKNHWKEDSDIDLVEQSIKELADLCNRRGYAKCYMTAPGCALGHLDWETQVKPLVDKYLDDRFIIADKGLQNKLSAQTQQRAPAPAQAPTQPAQAPAPAPTQPATGSGLTLCFTGQRPKDLMPGSRQAYSMESYDKFRKDLTLYLSEMYNAGYRNFISGGAQGFDQIAFWAVEDLKAIHPDIKNIAYLPFKGQEGAWRDTGGFSKTEYRKLVEKADEVVWTSEMQGITVDLVNNRNIGLALNRRNHAMVDDADLVIALYRDPNGFDPNKTGSGTNNCMKYAHDKGVPVYQIVYDNDDYGQIAPRSQINIIQPDVQRQPKPVPMWVAAKQQTQEYQAGQPSQTRDSDDLNAAYNQIQSGQEPDYPTAYDVDY